MDREELKKETENTKRRFIGKWLSLVDYLNKEVGENKIEFRISMQTDESFIIHPIGKDGETIDMDFYYV